MAHLRLLPSIDRLLGNPQVQSWLESFPRARVVDSLRHAVEQARQQHIETHPEAILECARNWLESTLKPTLVRVVNATGIILHTNLGRAPLSPTALEQIQQLCQGYCNLELDLTSARRGHRHHHLQHLMKHLTGPDRETLVVNNCAAAMLLIVDTFARGKEVLVSRGELVEIGGSFRIPEVLERGGAVLREVGTTNRTYLEDFRKAMQGTVGMLLSTHLSNFLQSGFVHSPDPAQLVALAKEFEVVSVLDLGSGLLEGVLQEPTVPEAVAQGWDLVAFSGDKLLGSAQAGLIVGRPDLIARLASNPWMRALRLDKLRLAALQGSLLDHLRQPGLNPVLAMLRTSSQELQKRAKRLAGKLKKRLAERARVEIRPSQASVGGGTTPGQQIASWAVCLQPLHQSLEEWTSHLRNQRPAVLARCYQDWIWLDMLCLRGDDEVILERALVQ